VTACATGWPTGGRPLGRLRRPPLWAAAAAALLLHAGLVSYRPATIGSDASSTATVMTVRTLSPRAIEPSASPVQDRSSAETADSAAAPALPVPATPDATGVTTGGGAPPGAAAAPVAQPGRLPAAPALSQSSKSADAPPAAAASSATVSTTSATVAKAAAPAPATAEAALPDAPDYLLGARLDPGPRPLGDIEPVYPESANLQEGSVVVRLLIGADGKVDNVGVVRAEPKGLFEQSALDAFGRARFSPGYVLGTPVKSQLTIEVHFQPINRGARVSGRTY
jgi:periplasmic protein TonB